MQIPPDLDTKFIELKSKILTSVNNEEEEDLCSPDVDYDDSRSLCSRY